ncbi:undecaprenyl-diphosphate phosphatase [Actinomyces sp.]|uniref:undecaprenyl-diphosphate phosphatase n=1 Tax=Actinomyces sp. TaxID=29317 RepID=UPI00289DE02A|nr:undecaprenyl-diphosphate phosphatase [Actinomyces sp.]
MSWLEAIILGLVQGLTEFLPISSSAHLRIVGELTGASDPGAAFTAITQIGTETAVLIFFWKDITRILSRWALSLPVVGPAKRVESSDPDARLGWMIIVGSLPIGILGLLLEDWIDTTFRNLWITVTMLVVFGLLLGLADRLGAKVRTLDRMSWRDAVLFGLAQAMALIPGVSRSGGTITMGRALGYTREAAARYSFLLAMPAVFASGFYKVAKVLSGGDHVDVGPTLVATLIAFAVGYLVIVWFLKLISTRSFAPFVWYRIGLAAVVAALLLTHVLEPLAGVTP